MKLKNHNDNSKLIQQNIVFWLKHPKRVLRDMFKLSDDEKKANRAPMSAQLLLLAIMPIIFSIIMCIILRILFLMNVIHPAVTNPLIIIFDWYFIFFVLQIVVLIILQFNILILGNFLRSTSKIKIIMVVVAILIIFLRIKSLTSR